MGTEKKFHPVYGLAIFYVIAIYLFPVLWFALNGHSESESEGLRAEQILPLLIPGFLGAVNLIVVLAGGRRLTREQLLHCAVIIKYGLIPFFIVGGACIALTWALTFSPVVIMIFVGPAIVAVFSVLGYMTLLGSAPFSIGYLWKSYRAGVHSQGFSIAGGIMQFFFTLDTISLMVLALKEKKCIKATIGIVIFLIVAFLALVTTLVALGLKGMIQYRNS